MDYPGMLTKARSLLLCLVLVMSGPVAFAKPDPLDVDVDIPYSMFKLDNGLTVIVHEDHKAPIVAFNVWYHVGSKNEERGHTGFAHLFEHLMFYGSKNYDNDFFKATEKLGATTQNGTTNWDRTNFFETVPKNALDSILWLESDRMANLLGALTQKKLDAQRAVVQNEKRQNENKPYGKAAEIQYASIYPYTHPYSWTTIGSMKDLNAASLQDVKDWFHEYYGAGNAVVVIAGDVTVDEIKQKTQHYFGMVQPGPPLTRQKQWVARLTGTHRQISYDRVPQTMMLKSWNIEGNSTYDTNMLDMVASVLSDGKSSRLYKRLVYDEQLVSSVSAYTSTGEIAGTFEITAMLNPGVDEDKVSRIIDEELARFLKSGPTREEVERVKVQTFSSFVRGIERVGGFGGKSDILASNYIYAGDPGYYKKELDWVKQATPKNLKQVANKWLSDGLYQLEIRPYQERKAAPSTVDRSKVPEPGTPPTTRFDDFQRATLPNGLKVIVDQRHAIPVVQMQLSLDAGYASDQFTTPGLAKLAMNMLDEGTSKRDALDISNELTMLGASLSTGSNLDTSFVSMSTLTTTLDKSLDIFADVVLHPSFPAKELPRVRKQQLTAIQRERLNPNAMAARVFPRFIYGNGHAYSNPLTGSGTTESVKGITLAQLDEFHDTWFKPNHATLIVVGDTTMDQVLPKIKAAFNDWQAGDIPSKNIGHVDRHQHTSIYLVDRPGSQSSILLAGAIAVPKANPQEVAIEAMNDVLGGLSTSRINMDLREDKGWSYGAYTGILNARGQRTFYVITSVQTDKTSESIAAAMNDLQAFVGDKPITEPELEKTVKSNSLSLAGRWESAGAVLGTISQLVQYQLPDDYFQQYPVKLKQLTLDEINAAAKQVVHPQSLVWIVVGDRARIGKGLEDLGLGPVQLIDADGNPVSE